MRSRRAGETGRAEVPPPQVPPGQAGGPSPAWPRRPAGMEQQEGWHPAPLPRSPALPHSPKPWEASSWDGVNQGFPGAENRNR